jgi:hypothetical protein
MSMQRAAAMAAELEAKNLTNAEPAMHAEAERRGAVLLPNQPDVVYLGDSL